MQRLFLGIDGGKTSTTALLAGEDGRVIGSGSSGPSNHVGAEGGQAKLLRAVTESVAGACQAASIDPSTVRFHSACFGASGGPEDKRATLVETLRAEHLTVTTDAVIALTGATGGEPGIITIAGTGSIAFGRNAAGVEARAGGWGYIFGDEGSAFDLARQGIRAALRHEEGWGPPTALHALFLANAGAQSASELLHAFYTAAYPRPRVASFGPLVERAAAEGDPVAAGILRKAAAELALLASAVRRQIFQPGDIVRVAHIGGVFRSTILREQFREMVEQDPGNECGPPLYPPAAGALLEAYRAAGLNPHLSGVPDVKR
jgi:N-acetylglucosamine kinase-like BadF-type ATPase